jgi:hypothetical protein
MWPRWALSSDSRCEGVSPAQLQRCRAEAGDVANLGYEDGRHHRAHTAQGLDSPITPVPPEALAGLALSHIYLVVEDLDQTAQRVHPVMVGLSQLQLVQQHLATGPNMSSGSGKMPHLAITACTWAFAEVRNATNLARYLTGSRRSLTSGGATQASGRSPRHSLLPARWRPARHF